jgi:hypothetical protein
MKVESYTRAQMRLEDFTALELRQQDLQTLPNEASVRANGEKLLAGGPANTLWIDGKPIACMGILRMFQHSGEAWIFCDKSVVNHAVTLLEAGREYLEFLTETYQLVRVQARCQTDWFEANKFLKHLDFKYEAELKYFGPNLEDYNQYVRLRPWVLSQQS